MVQNDLDYAYLNIIAYTGPSSPNITTIPSNNNKPETEVTNVLSEVPKLWCSPQLLIQPTSETVGIADQDQCPNKKRSLYEDTPQPPSESIHLPIDNDDTVVRPYHDQLPKYCSTTKS